MKVECRGKKFHVYTEKEAKKLNITPVKNWRTAKKGDWIKTQDGKVIEVIGKREEKPSNTKKSYIFIRTGYGECGVHKKHVYAQEQPNYYRDKYYFGKDLVKNVRPTAKQRTFVDALFLHGKTDKLGMWDAESIILAYQSIYKDNNPEQALRRGMGILKRKHIREYIAMNMREKLSAIGMDDDYVANKYRDMIENAEIPAATKLNALNRVSDMLGHLTKEKKEEQIEGVFALSDGDIKKLSSVRKTIAETTYGPKKDKNEQFYSSSTVKE
jgi:hypothetical protein|tara:strand:- start:1271 stop:2080 length:810 start_codon:yes stop_codon:yes gene_type:complete